MTGVGWRRWLLGVAVVSSIPLAIGGAACGGKSDHSPEPSAGSPGAASGGAADGGSAGSSGGATAGGGAAGGPSEGGVAGHAGGASGGASLGGGGSGGCCNVGDPQTCSADGSQLKRCALVQGQACDGSTSFYANVWQVEACPNGCTLLGSGPQCN